MDKNKLSNSLFGFTYGDQQVRVMVKDGEPWFVAKDVCDVLELDVTQTRRLDTDEKGLCSIQTPGGQQEMTCVNEPGLYTLVLGSRKPEAKNFKRWITHEVIPSIRKHGTYALPAASLPSYQIADPIERAQRWIEEEKKRLILEQQAAENAPKLSYLEKILQSTGALAITQIAKDYGLTGQELNRILHEEGVQFKVNGQWVLYSAYQREGLTKSNTYLFGKEDGEIGSAVSTHWTQAGRVMIHHILEKRGIGAEIDRQKNNLFKLVYVPNV